MQFAIFLFIIFLHAASMTLTRPILSLYATQHLHASPQQIGLLFAVYALLPMLFALRIGKLLDRYGAFKVGTAGGLGLVVSFVVPAVMPTMAGIVISQVISGLCNVFVVLAVQKAVGNRRGDRDFNLMWLTLMFAFSELFGPLIGGFGYEHLGFVSTCVIAASMSMAAVLAGVTLPAANWRSEAEPLTKAARKFTQSLGMIREPGVLKVILLSGLIISAKDLFVAYFPVYASSIRMDAGTVGVILSFSAVAAIAVRLGQGVLLKRFGRSRLLFGLLMLSGICFLLIPFTASEAPLFLLSGLIGAGLGLGQPFSLHYALTIVPRQRHGEMLGLRMTSNKFMQLAVPLLFGSVGGWLGLLPIFPATGLFIIAGAYATRIPDGGQKL